MGQLLAGFSRLQDYVKDAQRTNAVYSYPRILQDGLRIFTPLLSSTFGAVIACRIGEIYTEVTELTCCS